MSGSTVFSVPARLKYKVTLGRATSVAQAAALAELRRFYRLCGGRKLSYIERVA